MDQKGNLSFVFVFVILAVTIIFMFAFLAPVLTEYTLEVYTSAEPILEDANATAQLINDEAIKTSITTSLQESKNTTAMQIEVLSFFYQYSWLFVIALTALVLVLFTRFLVERQVTGGAV